MRQAGQSSLISKRPVVTGLSSEAGPYSGGSRLVISGRGLGGAHHVYVGYAEARPIVESSDSQIAVTVPPIDYRDAVGGIVVYVRVATPIGGLSEANEAARYLYEMP
jgi:hypothetical protein